MFFLFPNRATTQVERELRLPWAYNKHIIDPQKEGDLLQGEKSEENLYYLIYYHPLHFKRKLGKVIKLRSY